MSAAITPTDDIINSQTEILGMTTDNIISFDGQIMAPPNNESPFSANIRHVLSHQTTMNIVDPDNGEYGKITFDILSELGIFNMESFLNPHYWDAEELFKSDIIIKNIDQANAANHLECIHSFLRDRETLQTIEGCTAFNLASPDVNGISPFMRSFIPHALFPGQRVPLGTKITKTFNDVPHHGSITRFDPLTEYYHINYDDGDSEDFDLDECQQYFSVPTLLVSPSFTSSVEDPDHHVDPNPGENFITETTVEPATNEPYSGEKVLEDTTIGKSGEHDSWNNVSTGNSGENVSLFPFPEGQLPAAAAQIHSRF